MNTRRIAAIFLIVASVAAILLPFASATLLTIGLGGIVFVAGLNQLLRIGEIESNQGKIFKVCSSGSLDMSWCAIFRFY